MRKLLAIIWKENYLRFTDRTGALFMFVTPLALSIVMGLAFSGMAGPSDVPAFDIPVGIVNLDAGSDQGNFGDVFVQALVPADPENPDPDNPLFELFNAQVLDDEAAARAMVESGELTAILIIPPDFSAALTPSQSAFMAARENEEAANTLIGHTELALYWNQQSQIGWSIFRDVVQSIANGISTSSIAVSDTVGGLVQSIPSNPLIGLQLAAGSLNETFADVAHQSAQPDANPIRLTQIDVAGEQADSFDPLGFFSPGFAIFFLGFTVTLGSASILQEQQDWTLQRMVTTPTSRVTILAGKMLGTFVGGVLQMVVLILAMQAVGLLLQGPGSNIWGHDLVGVALVTLAAVAAACGVGTAIAAFARTAEQAGNMAAFILFTMGLAGGTFFPNVAVLLLLAVVFYGIGLWQFNRRIDI
jgi:ABC-2 type transport system permease protein